MGIEFDGSMRFVAIVVVEIARVVVMKLVVVGAVVVAGR